MTDLLSLIDKVPLSDCKREIDRQFQSISSHPNEMKLAVLASFILNGAMGIIRNTDPNKFLESLKDELEKEIREAEVLRQNQEMYMEHLDKNRELITNFETNMSNARALENDIKTLLEKYDRILQDMATERCRKSIAEIESKINK